MGQDARPLLALAPPVSRSLTILVAALLAGVGVALGALGAHGLEDRFVDGGQAWWETGVRYQMWHALALLAVAAIASRPGIVVPLAFVLGTAGFSGSLYAMALGSSWSGWGPITPLGGTFYLVGWLALIVRAARGEFATSSAAAAVGGAKGQGRGDSGDEE
jgi:uncharacterized membrane protein YgdD (TMEM256/DUF423 family)